LRLNAIFPNEHTMFHRRTSSIALATALAAMPAFSSAAEKREPAPMPAKGEATPLAMQVPMLSPE
jgi:hypothetical protein